MLDDHHKVMYSPLHLSYCAGTLVTVSLRLAALATHVRLRRWR
jgi:hypothetical protein